MSFAVERLDRLLYPAVQKNWDDLLFRERILARMRPTDVVLDVGAGAGIVAQMNFRTRARTVCGVDLDPRVMRNPYLDSARIASAESLPFADGSFDIVFSDNVLEHLEHPVRVFREVRRVLKPGGVFLVKTPNKWHYMPTIARLTPLQFHRFVNRMRGRKVDDTFPTRYRANSRADLLALADQSEMVVHSIDLFEGRPEYLRMAWPLYLAGWAYERAVNSIDILDRFRILLIAELQRPSLPPATHS